MSWTTTTPATRSWAAWLLKLLARSIVVFNHVCSGFDAKLLFCRQSDKSMRTDSCVCQYANSDAVRTPEIEQAGLNTIFHNQACISSCPPISCMHSLTTPHHGACVGALLLLLCSGACFLLLEVQLQGSAILLAPSAFVEFGACQARKGLEGLCPGQRLKRPLRKCTALLNIETSSLKDAKEKSIRVVDGLEQIQPARPWSGGCCRKSGTK